MYGLVWVYSGFLVNLFLFGFIVFGCWFAQGFVVVVICGVFRVG